MKGIGIHKEFLWESQRPRGRRRCKWKDNINVDLREIGYGVIDWIDLT
jgi:hypothetical protein